MQPREPRILREQPQEMIRGRYRPHGLFVSGPFGVHQAGEERVAELGAVTAGEQLLDPEQIKRMKPVARSAPRSGAPTASVPPLVNAISSRHAPMAAATASRAPSTSARALRPSACTDDGFPVSSSAAVIAAFASGRSGAVAL